MKTNDLVAGLQAYLNSHPALKDEHQVKVEDDSPLKFKKNGILHIQVEKKGRGGKIATFIDGFDNEWTLEEIEMLASEIKKRLGTGGSFRDNEILIQGNRKEEIKTFLKSKGYKVK